MSEITRPPVITLLGHVDHGKTSILDFIRKTAVAAKEYGGITQAIGAYQAETEGKLITFIDTPGHAAFEQMRSRGTGLADIAVLVVAVDDGVMPQTVEAIKHIQAADIPMIVAVNKIDLPGIDIKVQMEKIKKQLSDQKVLVEEYGGDTPIVQISAKTGQGIKDLLETINLLAEIHDFKGDRDKGAEGIIVESRLDKFKGPLATVLVRDGTLNKGDQIKAGDIEGKVRGMFDWAGKAVEKAGPSTPVEVLGFAGIPPVGARLGEKGLVTAAIKAKAASLIERLREDESKILNLVVRADTQGSLQAIETLLNKFNEKETHIKMLEKGTGEINDSDIETAQATRAIVIGFNVGIKPTAKRMAEVGHVLIRHYNIIYELGDEIKDVVEGILQPGKVEEVFGRCQIIAQFPYGKTEKVAGCRVMEGTISKGPKVRIVREEEVIGEGKIKSLKKVKEEVSKVEKGMECGMLFEPPIDFKIGDIVESFRLL